MLGTAHPQLVFIIHLARMGPVSCVLKWSICILQRLALHKKSIGDIRIRQWILDDVSRGWLVVVIQYSFQMENRDGA